MMREDQRRSERMEAELSRRNLLRTCAGGGAALLTPRGIWAAAGEAAAGDAAGVPVFLPDRAEAYRADPRKAMLEWFRQARFGLFMHYGLYSQLGRGEWVMHREKIPVAEYKKLQQTFTAEKFDPDFICDLALAAGMKYVNITARHHDGFCLFKTQQTEFQSLKSPARRDLVGELAEACRRKGLALFLYYSYALDWTHPYFFPRSEDCQCGRPAYDKPEPSYLWKSDADFAKYLDYVHAQIRELLQQYRPAGVWFDPLMGYYCRPEVWPLDRTYVMIRQALPGCLISFKQGANGDEDFVAPEREAQALKRAGKAGQVVWAKNQGKPVEICNTLQPSLWGYEKDADGKHKNADAVMKMLTDAAERKANLLLNTGPLADGSIHPEDVATLREVGRKKD